MDTRKEKAISITHEFLQSGVDLPFSTEVGPQLLSLSSKPVEEIDIDKLVKLIQMDPGLATKVLQLANSVYFSGLSKIISLRRAIVQIGLEEAINFIHVVFYRNSLPKFPSIEDFFSDKDYWSHSWACAVASKMLGHPTVGAKVLPGELYIAGLLHGIGKLILAIHRPEEFLQCLQNSKDFQQPLPEAQLDILGTTDADIACELLKAWQLPDNICMAIKYLQNPHEAEDEYREFAGLIQFAYYIANTSGIGNIKDEFCFDVKQTWICQESNSPLADESMQEGFVQRIYAVLDSKQASLATFGGESKTENSIDEPVQNYSKKPVAKKGWFTRFGDWLKALLS